MHLLSIGVYIQDTQQPPSLCEFITPHQLHMYNCSSVISTLPSITTLVYAHVGSADSKYAVADAVECHPLIHDSEQHEQKSCSRINVVREVKRRDRENSADTTVQCNLPRRTRSLQCLGMAREMIIAINRRTREKLSLQFSRSEPTKSVFVLDDRIVHPKTRAHFKLNLQKSLNILKIENFHGHKNTGTKSYRF